MFWFYLLAKLDDIVFSLNMFGYVGLFISGVLTVIFCAMSDFNTYNHEEFVLYFSRLFKSCRLKALIVCQVIALIIATLLPSTKQAAFIWVAPQIVENGAVKDTVKNIPELTKLGTEYLKQLLEEKTNGHEK